jgi:hypothetical protein
MKETTIHSPFTFRYTEFGRVTPPDSCQCIVYDRTRKVCAAGTAAISGEGECVFNHDIDVFGDYLVEWNLTVGSRQICVQEMCSIVKSDLYPTITDTDLYAECAALEESHYYHRGEVSAAENGSITDNSLIGSMVNYTGATLEFLTGQCTGMTMIVSGFIGNTGTLRLSSMNAIPDAGSVYLMKKPFHAERSLAFDEIRHKVTQQSDYRPALIVSPDAFRFAHIYLSLAKICRGLSVNPDDVWMHRALYYDKQFEYAWSGIRFAYDYTHTIRDVSSHQGFLR